MFEDYTIQARAIIFKAKKKASEAGAAEVAPEHILFALLRDDEAWSHVMESREQVQRDLLERMAAVPEPATRGDMPLGPAAIKVLQLASADAVAAQSKQICGVHLLVGLTCAEGSWVSGLLQRNGLTRRIIHSGIQTSGMGENLGQRGKNWLRRFLGGTHRASPEENLLGSVIGLAGKGKSRAALTLIDKIIADSKDERTERIRLLAPHGVAIASSMGDYSAAKRYCEMDLACNPESLLSLYGMATCLDSLGEHAEAQKFAKRCRHLAQDASHQEAQGVVELVEKRFPDLDAQRGEP